METKLGKAQRKCNCCNRVFHWQHVSSKEKLCRDCFSQTIEKERNAMRDFLYGKRKKHENPDQR